MNLFFQKHDPKNRIDGEIRKNVTGKSLQVLDPLCLGREGLTFQKCNRHPRKARA